MLRFIGTIKLADGHYELIGGHNKRINDTINHFFGFNLSSQNKNVTIKVII